MDTVIARQRMVLLPWRIAFVLYAAALTVGTHWPRLQLHVGDEPAPNKIVHMLAFGGLTFLLWRTRWLGSGLRLLLVVLAWSLVDEYTQGLPGLGRTVSWMDIVANWSGIIIVFAWIRAIQPIGGTLNRMRLKLTEFVIDELFTRWQVWLLAIASGFVMGALIGGVATWITWAVHPDATMYAAFLSIPAGGLGGAYLLLDAMWRRERERVAHQCRCLHCGKVCANVDVDERGIGVCPSCATPFHLGQWQQRANLTREMLLRLAVRPMMFATLLCILAAMLYVLGVVLYMRFPQEFQAFRRFDRLPMDLRLVIDMTVLGCIAAIAVRRFRVNLARVVDHQGDYCRRCSHDVHATRVERGMGRCPECGTVFIRLDDEAADALNHPVRT
jgi:ribosomal protein L37AE/L43A